MGRATQFTRYTQRYARDGPHHPVYKKIPDEYIFPTPCALGILHSHGLHRHSRAPWLAWRTGRHYGVGCRSLASATHSSAAGSESISGTFTALAGTAAEADSPAAFAGASTATGAPSAGEAATTEKPSLVERKYLRMRFEAAWSGAVLAVFGLGNHSFLLL